MPSPTPTVPADPAAAPLIHADGLLPGARVFLKDETRHPSGSHKEPAARAVVARALAQGHDRVVVGSCGSYGRAMATACAAAGLHCTVVLPAGWSDGGTFATATGADVRFVQGDYEDAVEASHRLAAVEDAADGNVDGPYQDAIAEGHGTVVDALYGELGGAPVSLWVPIGNGTTVVAAHRRLLALDWPVALHGAGSRGNNPIVVSWPDPYRMLSSDDVVTTEHNEPLVNRHALHGPEAMAAITASGGTVQAVDDDELLAAQALLGGYGLRPTPAGSAALAGLLARARTTSVGGDHVVLLSGR